MIADFKPVFAMTLLLAASPALAQLSASGNMIWNQDSPAIFDVGETEDRFATVIASGDFNADGFEDFAFGIPKEDIGAVPDAGAVAVIYGSENGLTAVDNELWYQGVNFLGDNAESGDNFGASLAVGDFNNDTIMDLAIGVPGEDVGVNTDTGIVQVLIGSLSGLVPVDRRFDQTFFSQSNQPFDHFGKVLVSGDFDGNGFDDLAIGIPDKDVDAIADAGSVLIARGDLNLVLTPASVMTWSQASSNIGDEAETEDFFGTSLAAGDFNGDDYDDLAIGVPLETYAGIEAAGLVHVLYGTDQGLTSIDNQLWNQVDTGLLEFAETNDQFGSQLTHGDFDGDGKMELVIGVINEARDGTDQAGIVHVLLGNAPRLSATGAEIWYRNVPGMIGPAEEDEQWGTALAVGDFNADGASDLVASMPNANITRGEVQVVYGKPGVGLTAVGNQIWSQDSPGVGDVGNIADFFGQSLATGDSNGDGSDELVIGTPAESLDLRTAAGTSNLLFGSDLIFIASFD